VMFVLRCFLFALFYPTLILNFVFKARTQTQKTVFREHPSKQTKFALLISESFAIRKNTTTRKTANHQQRVFLEWKGEGNVPRNSVVPSLSPNTPTNSNTNVHGPPPSPLLQDRDGRCQSLCLSFIIAATTANSTLWFLMRSCRGHSRTPRFFSHSHGIQAPKADCDFFK